MEITAANTKTLSSDPILNGNAAAREVGFTIAIDTGNGLGVYSRDFRRVGVIVDECIHTHDGVPYGYEMALGSRIDGVIAPVIIEITGRRMRNFGGDLWGHKATVTFYNDGEDTKVDAIVNTGDINVGIERIAGLG